MSPGTSGSVPSGWTSPRGDVPCPPESLPVHSGWSAALDSGTCSGRCSPCRCTRPCGGRWRTGSTCHPLKLIRAKRSKITHRSWAQGKAGNGNGNGPWLSWLSRKSLTGVLSVRGAPAHRGRGRRTSGRIPDPAAARDRGMSCGCRVRVTIRKECDICLLGTPVSARPGRWEPCPHRPRVRKSSLVSTEEQGAGGHSRYWLGTHTAPGRHVIQRGGGRVPADTAAHREGRGEDTQGKVTLYLCPGTGVGMPPLREGTGQNPGNERLPPSQRPLPALMHSLGRERRLRLTKGAPG